MVLTILIVVISLSLLMALHEFGHFILAKKLGVKVEEFGIGMPPKIFGKKIGETIYSFNLIPFGAFVKIYGEENSKESFDPRSFTAKPIWQRMSIVLGGVVSFWIISLILFTIVLGYGAATAVGDEENPNFLNPKVQILSVASDSPAEKSNLKTGDAILKLQFKEEILETDKVEQVRQFIKEHDGLPLLITIQRGKKIFERTITPQNRVLGVYLARTAIIKYPWFSAPVEGARTTLRMTKFAFLGYLEIFKSIFEGKGLPEGTELMGPVGAGALLTGAFETSFVYFLQILATLSILFAIFNLLPIPALDGGRLVFLVVEKIKGKPINREIEKNINSLFLFLLMGLMIFVTAKDIMRLF